MGHRVLLDTDYYSGPAVAGNDQREGSHPGAKHADPFAGFDQGGDAGPFMGGANRVVDLGEIKVEEHAIFPVHRDQPLLSGKHYKGAGTKFTGVFAIPSGCDLDRRILRQDQLANGGCMGCRLGRDPENGDIAYAVKTARETVRINVREVLVEESSELHGSPVKRFLLAEHVLPGCMGIGQGALRVGQTHLPGFHPLLSSSKKDWPEAWSIFDFGCSPVQAQ